MSLVCADTLNINVRVIFTSKSWWAGCNSSGNLWCREAWATQSNQGIGWTWCAHLGLLQAGVGSSCIPMSSGCSVMLKQWGATQTPRLYLGPNIKGGKASRRRRHWLGLVSQRLERTPCLQRSNATSAAWLECREGHMLVKAKRLQHARAGWSSWSRSDRALRQRSRGSVLILPCRLSFWSRTVSGIYPLWACWVGQVRAHHVTQLVGVYWPRHISHTVFDRTVTIFVLWSPLYDITAVPCAESFYRSSLLGVLAEERVGRL